MNSNIDVLFENLKDTKNLSDFGNNDRSQSVVDDCAAKGSFKTEKVASGTALVLNKICEADKRYSILDGKEHIIVALSGGADSVCLLHSLYMLKNSGKYSFKLSAAHLNHCLRGEEAVRDMEFSKSFAESLGCEFFSRSVDVAQWAKKLKVSTETCGRMKRYEFFDELAKSMKAVLATAHTASDNSETVIFNIARGSSIKGLSGIPPVRGKVIRPLLFVTREEVEDYCLENNLSFVTDSTNLTDDYTRNSIRHKVIPVLKSLNEGLNGNITRLSQSARLVDDYMQQSALEAIKSSKGKCKMLKQLHPALLSYCVNLIYLKKTGENINQNRLTELCCEAIKREKGAVQINERYVASVENGFFVIKEQSISAEIKKGLVYLNLDDIINGSCSQNSIRVAVDGKIYIFEIVEEKEGGEKADEECQVILDLEKCRGAVFRTRDDGDLFTLKKRRVTKTLKKYFNEIKLPPEKRYSLPMVAVKNDVLWIEGIGAAWGAEFSKNSKRGIKISVSRHQTEV